MAEHGLRNDPLEELHALAGRSLRAAYAEATATPARGTRLLGTVFRRAGRERVLPRESAASPRLARQRRADAREPRSPAGDVEDEPLRRGGQAIAALKGCDTR